MKKILFFILSFILFTTFVYAESYILELSPDKVNASKGDIIDVNVSIKGLAQNLDDVDGLDTVYLEFVFDKNVLEIVNQPNDFKVIDGWIVEPYVDTAIDLMPNAIEITQAFKVYSETKKFTSVDYERIDKNGPELFVSGIKFKVK